LIEWTRASPNIAAKCKEYARPFGMYSNPIRRTLTKTPADSQAERTGHDIKGVSPDANHTDRDKMQLNPSQPLPFESKNGIQRTETKRSKTVRRKFSHVGWMVNEGLVYLRTLTDWHVMARSVTT